MSKIATTAYLVLYNAACMAGWGWTLFLALESVYDRHMYGDSLQKGLASVWKASSEPLIVVQWAMCMEILHAITGLVPSPPHVVFLQVFSRVFVLAAAQNFAPVTSTWACGLMIISWCLVEVPRYLFYIFAKLGPPGPKGTPYFIFYLRYSLFFILYPTGITGEVLTLMNALPLIKRFTIGYTHMKSTVNLYGYDVDAKWVMFIIQFVLWTYLPGGPFMYMNMVGNRKNAFSKRNPPPPKPETGTVFPKDGSPEDTRATTETGKKIIEAALRGAGGEEANKAADKVKKERSWRFKYVKHYEQLVRVGVSSKQAALGSAKAGLDWIYENFEFIKDGKCVKFKEAMAACTTTPFHTGVVKGTKATDDHSYRVPYDGGWHPSSPKPPAPSAVLHGSSLKAQLEKWVKGGVIEKDASDAVAWTADYFSGKKDLSQCYFVMIGAGSAMGPFAKLLECGANVVALDIPGKWGSPARPTLWRRLVKEARNSRGSIIFPLSAPQADCKDDDALCAAAGADLTQQPFEIANWLVKWAKTLPPEARVVIGNYTYLDGDMHVKLALCADVLIQALRKERPSTAVAFLCTPTDLHVVPEEAAEANLSMYNSGPGNGVYLFLEHMIMAFSGFKYLRKNHMEPAKYRDASSIRDVHLVDGLSVAQGPNYALAKRMQHWRAVIEYEGGATVSSMVAPSTATLSVIHNRAFAWAYGGMPYFGFEIFKQETTNAIMAAILIQDVYNEWGPKNPKNRKTFGINSALEVFKWQAVHGGLWRAPYKVDSIGEVSVLVYFMTRFVRPYLLHFAVIMGAVWYGRQNGKNVTLVCPQHTPTHPNPSRPTALQLHIYIHTLTHTHTRIQSTRS